MKFKFNIGLWDYPVTRKVTVERRLLPILWIFSLGYITVVVLLVLAGDEFEYKVEPPTADYNATVRLWYQPFIPNVLKNYTKDAWICSPNILTLDLFTNNTGFFSYNLRAVPAIAGGDPTGGIAYANNLLMDCTPYQISLTPPTDLTQSIQATVGMSCFTTRGEWVLLSMQLEDQRYTATQTNGENYDAILNSNFGTAVYNWVVAEFFLLNSGPDIQSSSQSNIPVIGPTTGPVIMQYSWEVSNSFIEQEYEGLNTPAYDFWVLNITRGSDVNPLQIVFLANGSVDLTRTDPKNLTEANTIIPSGSDNVTFWQTVNWLYVSLYWTTLIDFGQYSPYLVNGTTNIGFYPAATNNLFLNSTLLQSYYSFYNTSLAPFLDGYALSIPQYVPPKPVYFPTTFLQSYTCSKLAPRSPLTLFISVIVGCYTFIVGGYGFAKFVVAFFYKHRHKGQADYCEGCLEKLEASRSEAADKIGEEQGRNSE